ncbi:nef attachable domain protein, partial [Chlamydia psittaci C1/97]
MKRNYLRIKTGKKLSEKLLWVLLIHLTDLQLSPQEA